MNTKKFGERVAALRKDRNLTQAQLAEQLNVSNKTISRWETGDGYPEITLLMPLAKTLGVSVDELLEDNEDDNNGETKCEDKADPFQKASGKEYKHKDIPVQWPSFKLSFSYERNKTINHLINLLFFIGIVVIYHSAAQFKNYSVYEQLSMYTSDGAGYFCDAWLGYVLMGITVLLFAGVLFFNIKAKSKDYINGIQLVKNVVISTGFTVFSLLNFTFVNGEYNFHSITYSWIHKYEEGTFLNCDFFKFNIKIIMLTLMIAVAAYILGEIIINIVNHVKTKKSDESDESLEHKAEPGSFRRFWNSLTIFNKFGTACIFLDIACVIIALVLSIIAKEAVMVVPLMVMLPSGISKVGLSFSALGLALGLLDIYDRQNKASIIIVIINLAAVYIIPMFFTLISVGGILAGSTITNILSNI